MANDMFHWRTTWSDNKVRELIAVKMLHTSLLNIFIMFLSARNYFPQVRLLSRTAGLASVCHIQVWFFVTVVLSDT
jgi:hypothetical protein